MTQILTLSRRGLLLGVAAGGAVAALGWAAYRRPAAETAVPLLAWLEIAADGTVTLLHITTDLGQGTPTALAQIVADQLDVPWRAMRLRQAPVRAPFDGEDVEYATSASSGIRAQYDELRTLGATARAMLAAAAAQLWQVPVAEIESADGTMRHRPTGRSLGYGELAPTAAALPVPKDVRPRPVGPDSAVGKPMARLGIPPRVDGSAVYGIDMRLPDMLVATVAHAPVRGGTLARVDPAPALAVPGVRQVVPLGGAVAVAADGYGQAAKGLAALSPEWTLPAPADDAAPLTDRLRGAALGAEGRLAAPEGVDPAVQRRWAAGELAAAPVLVDALYETPLAAHMTMEPQTATARVAPSGAELWLPTQNQSLARRTVAAALDLPVDRVTITSTAVGGGFGRRLEPDAAVQAALTARAVGRPVKLIWSREQDVAHDFFRPPAAVRMRLGAGRDGRLRVFCADVACPSLLASSASTHPLGEDGVDFTALMGLLPVYDCPPPSLRWTDVPVPVRVGWWRSVGAFANCFAVESAIDELARAVGQSPMAFRRRNLASSPRALAVLDALEAMAGDHPPIAGRHRGMALSRMSGTFVAMQVELSVTPDREVVLHQVWAAVDCGLAVNPDAVRAQVEGAILWGLSACLLGEISVRDGKVEQSNFHDYPVLQLAQTPSIAVRLLGDGPPGGAGEEAVPPLAPAIANALFAATGTRHRTLPFTRSGMTLAAAQPA